MSPLTGTLPFGKFSNNTAVKGLVSYHNKPRKISLERK